MNAKTETAEWKAVESKNVGRVGHSKWLVRVPSPHHGPSAYHYIRGFHTKEEALNTAAALELLEAAKYQVEKASCESLERDGKLEGGKKAVYTISGGGLARMDNATRSAKQAIDKAEGR